ncbi:Uncharacterised protein [Clostridioides difficile]|nr:Uncharacterised protein [Clostridioides difficile]
MKKLFIKYNDGSGTTYTMENRVDHEKYVYKHINVPGIESIILQQYPKSKYEPVVYIYHGFCKDGQKEMLKYDIDWYLAFQGNVSTSLINRLTNTLGLDEYDAVPYSNADLTYKIKRSLDIMMPIILTKCIGHKIDAFRDCGANKFIIKISN